MAAAGAAHTARATEEARRDDVEAAWLAAARLRNESARRSSSKWKRSQLASGRKSASRLASELAA